MKAKLGHQDADRTVFSDLHDLCGKGVSELQKNQNQPKAEGGDWQPLLVQGNPGFMPKRLMRKSLI